jgi:sulfonate transport system ATP-binding protein
MALKLHRQLSEQTLRGASLARPPVTTAFEGASGPLAVQVCDARRSFAGREILRGVDLTVRPGEFVALLGRSGSGKSTLLRALAGLDPATTGVVRTPERRAVVFQDARLLPWARVLDNVALGLRSAETAGRVGRALAEVGLTDRARSWPETLSGGEAKRAALARAIVREPALLLLDEPFGALDALTRIQMHELLRELCDRHRPAVLLVTHDVDEALLLADRVLVLSDGRITTSQTVDLPTPRHRTLAGFAELREGLLDALGVCERIGSSSQTATPHLLNNTPQPNRPKEHAS